MAADLENTIYLDVPAGPRRHRHAPRSGARHLRPDQGAGAPRLLRRADVSPGDRRLYGADRRPERRRHRRLGPPAQGRVLQRAVCPRHGGDGAHLRPQQRRQPVFHHVRAGALARRQIHDLGQGRLRHGVCRPDQEGRPASNGSVSNPDKIVKMQVAADAKRRRQSLSHSETRRMAPRPSPLPARGEREGPAQREGEGRLGRRTTAFSLGVAFLARDLPPAAADRGIADGVFERAAAGADLCDTVVPAGRDRRVAHRDRACSRWSACPTASSFCGRR